MATLQSQSPLDTFKENIFTHQATANQLKRKSVVLATFRLLAFLIGLVALVYFANEGMDAVFWSVLPGWLVVFTVLVVWHKRVSISLKKHVLLVEVNQEETQRFHLDFSGMERAGKDHLDKKHPYTYDLDIFGERSLFHWLNRTNTLSGEQQLAKWLSNRAELSEIHLRQQAVRELAPMISWRQNLQVEARFTDAIKIDLSTFYSWLETPLKLVNAAFLKYAIWVLPLHIIVQLTLFFTRHGYSFFWVIVSLFVNLAVVGAYNKYMIQFIEEAGKSLSAFRFYHHFMEQVQQQEFESDWLKKRKTTFEATESLQAIHRLKKLLTWLDYRSNALFAFTVNAAFLLDIRWVLALEKWKEINREQVHIWISQLAEIEGLSSFAGMWFLRPAFTLPEVTAQPFQFTAKGMGHPLIAPEKRVDNEASMEGNGKLIILSGSNMAGKSTYLRTLGLNTALALAGAPVCATKMTVSAMQVFTSMRIEDSLNENLSSFYAELTRLHQLFELLKEREDVFFLLDELLRGTNSEDRHRGTKAILEKVLKTKASGIVATHDLALASLSSEYPEQTSNFSFESEILNGEVKFDYKLKEGVCRSFNAYELMKGLNLVD